MKNKQFLVLLGSGRSGTTLVQRLLNSYQDIMIWGEHQGSLKALSESYFSLVDSKSMNTYSYPLHKKLSNKSSADFKNPEIWQAWINWFEKDDVTDIFKHTVESLFKANDSSAETVGFKEIRYAETPEVLEFLNRILPKLKIICVVRDPLNNVESQVNTFAQGNGRFRKLRRLLLSPFIFKTALRWRKQNNNILKMSESCDYIDVYRYEDIINDVTILNASLECIGKSIGKQQIDILNVKQGRGSAYSDSDVNKRWENLGFVGKIIVLICTFTVREKYHYPKVTKVPYLYRLCDCAIKYIVKE